MVEADILAKAKQFLKKKVQPKSSLIDERNELPVKLFREIGEKGLLGFTVPKNYGGLGLNTLMYIKFMIELAKASPSLAASITTHTMVEHAILNYGLEEQKEKYLPAMVKGGLIGAFAMTEPGAGSDMNRISTSSSFIGDKFVLNGEKIFITNGAVADLFLMVARTGTDSKGRAELSVFIVERKTKGLDVKRKIELSGIRGAGVAHITLSNCQIPRENLLGEVGQGFRIAMDAITVGKISYAAIGIGIASQCLEKSMVHSIKRKQFGNPLIKFEGVGFPLAEIAVELEAARLLTFEAASKMGKGEKVNLYTSMAKLYSTKVAVKSALKAVQIHGAYGYSKESGIERLLRDAKGLEIGEGTSEIQKKIIIRELSKNPGKN